MNDEWRIMNSSFILYHSSFINLMTKLKKKSKRNVFFKENKKNGEFCGDFGMWISDFGIK